MEVQASVAKNGEAKGTVGQRGDSEAWQGWVKLEGLVPTSHTSCSPAAAELKFHEGNTFLRFNHYYMLIV